MTQLIFKCEDCKKEFNVDSRYQHLTMNRCPRCNSVFVFPTFKNHLGVNIGGYKYKNGKFTFL